MSHPNSHYRRQCHHISYYLPPKTNKAMTHPSIYFKYQSHVIVFTSDIRLYTFLNIVEKRWGAMQYLRIRRLHLLSYLQDCIQHALCVQDARGSMCSGSRHFRSFGIKIRIAKLTELWVVIFNSSMDLLRHRCAGQFTLLSIKRKKLFASPSWHHKHFTILHYHYHDKIYYLLECHGQRDGSL